MGTCRGPEHSFLLGRDPGAATSDLADDTGPNVGPIDPLDQLSYDVLGQSAGLGLVTVGPVVLSLTGVNPSWSEGMGP